MALSTSFLLVLIGISFILTQAHDQHHHQYGNSHSGESLHGSVSTKPATSIQCRPDQEYRWCSNREPPTCSNYNRPPSRKPCVSGCFCKKGFLPDDYGSTCIPEEKCRSCRGNTMYRQCGTACPKTCSNMGTIELCILLCVEGCFCKPGYVLLNASDKTRCVLPKNCPPPSTTLGPWS